MAPGTDYRKLAYLHSLRWLWRYNANRELAAGKNGNNRLVSIRFTGPDLTPSETTKIKVRRLGVYAAPLLSEKQTAPRTPMQSNNKLEGSGLAVVETDQGVGVGKGFVRFMEPAPKVAPGML